MWDLIVSVPDHCLSFYFSELYIQVSVVAHERLVCLLFPGSCMRKTEDLT